MTTIVIAAVVGLWIIGSATLVVFLCMNSSRLSHEEEEKRKKA